MPLVILIGSMLHFADGESVLPTLYKRGYEKEAAREKKAKPKKAAKKKSKKQTALEEGPSNHILAMAEEGPTNVIPLSGSRSQESPVSSIPEDPASGIDSELAKRLAVLEETVQTLKGSAPESGEPVQKFTNPYEIFKRVSGAFRTRGPGYATDYGTLSTLITSDYQRGKAFPLVDLRAHALFNGQWAANVGVGFRIVPHNGCMIFGMNAFYDYRTNPHGNFNQFGLGFELLSQRWGLHFNGYLPFDGHKHSDKHVYDDYIGDFRVTCRQPDFAFDSFNLGMDFELVHQGMFFVFGEINPYYFSSKHHGKHSVGIMAGLRPQFDDYLAIELNVSHDSIFGTIYQAAATLTFPLYQFGKQKGKKGPCGLPNRVIYQPIQRNELIPLKKGCCHYHANF